MQYHPRKGCIFPSLPKERTCMSQTTTNKPYASQGTAYPPVPALDIHNHTVFSGHAYSSLQEMVRAASEAGIGYFGVTDHGPATPGACDPFYFRNFGIIPRLMYGVRLLMGAELNITDCEGTLDLPERYWKHLDILLAGVHRVCWRGGTREQNTEGVLRVMGNPRINVITHPGDGASYLDFEALVRASRDSGTLLEINSSSMLPTRHADKAVPNNRQILRLCRRMDTPVILGSDAHISFDVGNYKYALGLLGEESFPVELVANYNPDLFFSFTGVRPR